MHVCVTQCIPKLQPLPPTLSSKNVNVFDDKYRGSLPRDYICQVEKTAVCFMLFHACMSTSCSCSSEQTHCICVVHNSPLHVSSLLQCSCAIPFDIFFISSKNLVKNNDAVIPLCIMTPQQLAFWQLVFGYCSKRNSLWANSALVVSVQPSDWAHLEAEHGALAGVALQVQAERYLSHAHCCITILFIDFMLTCVGVTH